MFRMRPAATPSSVSRSFRSHTIRPRWADSQGAGALRHRWRHRNTVVAGRIDRATAPASSGGASSGGSLTVDIEFSSGKNTLHTVTVSPGSSGDYLAAIQDGRACDEYDGKPPMTEDQIEEAERAAITKWEAWAEEKDADDKRELDARVEEINDRLRVLEATNVGGARTAEVSELIRERQRNRTRLENRQSDTQRLLAQHIEEERADIQRDQESRLEEVADWAKIEREKVAGLDGIVHQFVQEQWVNHHHGGFKVTSWQID